MLVDGDGVARAVADREGLGVTVGDGLAFGVALLAVDADGDGCGRVGFDVDVDVVGDDPGVPVAAGGW